MEKKYVPMPRGATHETTLEKRVGVGSAELTAFISLGVFHE